jgi:hypothetical protein
MSKFRIYREESSDPVKIGRGNKKLYVIYTLSFFLLLLTINLYYTFKKEHYSLILYFSILLVFICVTALVIYRMKKQVDNLKEIGTLEFTKTCIKKEIGDLSMTYKYDSLLQIEVEKYLRDLSISSNKSGPSIYILKITGIDASQDNFIVSNRSLDFRQRIGIIDTLKTIKALTGLNTILNNN